MLMPLTDSACKNAKPREKDYKLSDAGQLYLLVKANGSKLWRMNYRMEGRQKTYSIGIYPAVSLAEARRARDAAKELVAQGVDPVHKSTATPDRTFQYVAKEWFNSRAAGWVSTYSNRIWSRLVDDVFPEIGDKDVAEIEPSEVLALLRKIENRDALEMAKRVRQTVSNVFEFAVATGKARIDPAASLRSAMKKAPRQTHRSALNADELPEFFKRLRNYDCEPQTKVALELIVHTFVRTSELRFAKWGEISQDMWLIPAERMKMRRDHMVPLTAHARGLFERLREMSNGSEWVVPGAFGKKPISENTLLFCLYRLGYASRATIHGFRTTASTILNESGLWSADAIERQLAHVPANEIRGIYNRAERLPERVRMMDWYTSYLLKKDTDLSDLLS